MWGKDLTKFEHFHFGIAETFFKGKSWTSKQNSRGYQFFAEGYIHDVFTHESDSIIKAKCYRSQKKNATPHRLHIQFSAAMDSILEAHCTCEAG